MHHTEFYYGYSSPKKPSSIFKEDIQSGESDLVWQQLVSNYQDSIQYCFKYVGYPIIIASICLFIGFLFLTQSIFISNYIIGGMCALIIAIALLVDLLLLPALLLISSRKA